MAPEMLYASGVVLLSYSQRSEILVQDSPKFQAILANLPQVVVCVTRDGTITYINHTEAGYRLEQVLGSSAFDFLPSEFQGQFQAALDQVIQQGKSTQIELPSWKADGQTIHYDCQLRPLFADGRVSEVLIVATDITSHKLIASRLQKTQTQNEETLSWFKLLSDQSNDAHLFVDREGKIQYVNHRACEMLQYTEDELLQLRIFDIAPGSEVRLPLFFQQTSHRIPPFEAIYLKKDGTQFPVEISLTATPYLGKLHLCAAVRDLSERKSLQKELQKSQEELQDFLNNATVGMHWVGPDGKILWANQAELAMLGYASPEYVGHHISRFHVDPSTIQEMLTRLARGESLQDYPARLRCKDGSIRHVLIDSNVWFEGGKFIHTRCFTRDVTDSYKAQSALKKHEERLSVILQAAEIGTWEWDWERGKFQWSPNTYRIHGVIPGELGETLETFLEKIHGEDRERVKTSLRQAQQDLEQIHFEYRLNVQAGQEERWFEGVCRALHDAEGQSARVVGICRDVTKQKRQEFALRQQDRLTAVGTLAAGLAHEINNPLSALLTTAGVAGRLLSNPDHVTRMSECLGLIQSEAERIRQIVKNVACFAKQGSSPKSFCDADVIAGRAGERIRAYAETRKVKVELECEEFLPQILANATEIEQVLINLLSNAIDASREGQTVSLHIGRDPDFLQFSVMDQGGGMTQSEKDRAFDPFYTSKQETGGTGLGLSIVHRIVTDHGGRIEIHSSPEGGTKMLVYLPIPS